MVEIVVLVVLVAGVVVVFAEAFAAYRAGGALERRLARIEEGQRAIMAELRERPAAGPAAGAAAPTWFEAREARTSITLLEVKVPRSGRPNYVEVTQWMHAAPPHADAGRLRAITADYLASAAVDPDWDSVTARWTVTGGRAADLGDALHGALVGTPVTAVREVTGLPADLPSALSLIPPEPGARLVPVARVAGVVLGPSTPDPVLTAASFKSLVRSELTDVIGRAIGDGLFTDRPAAPPPLDLPTAAPVSAWPFADDPS